MDIGVTWYVYVHVLNMNSLPLWKDLQNHNSASNEFTVSSLEVMFFVIPYGKKGKVVPVLN
jgi:hypothetical protein